MNSEGKMSPCDDIRKLMPPKRNHRHKQLWMNSEECCLWLEVTSWFAQPGEFSERRFKISSHAHRERTSWEVRDCDKKEGIAGNRYGQHFASLCDCTFSSDRNYRSGRQLFLGICIQLWVQLILIFKWGSHFFGVGLINDK